MKIFIDSADTVHITEAISWGFVDGVTTNPSLIKKATEHFNGLDLQGYVGRILDAASGRPVSLEVIGTTYDEMIDQGWKLYTKFESYGKVVIKIPITPCKDPADKNQYDGLKAIRWLSSQNVPVNTTLIMTPEQALLAARAGAAYVSPFAGRIDDYLREKGGHTNDAAAQQRYYDSGGEKVKNGNRIVDDNGIVSGVDLVSQIVQIFKAHNIKTEVLAASIRNVRQVREVALAGAHIATIPFTVLEQMVRHEKTYEGVQRFLKDAEAVPEYKKLFE